MILRAFRFRARRGRRDQSVWACCTRRAAREFEQAHVELARKVVTVCRGERIETVLHMRRSMRTRPVPPLSAHEGRRPRGARFRLAWTIFRPSVTLAAVTVFSTCCRATPVRSVLAARVSRCPLSAVFVEDVAAAFERSSKTSRASARAAILRPQGLHAAELVEYVNAVTGRRRLIIGLNDAMSYAQASTMELPPFKQILRALDMLMTRDNYYR